MADPVTNYPVTPANITRAAIYAAAWAARVPPTPPPLTLAAADVQAQRDGLAQTAALTPLESLQIYPQTINAEYLTPMSTLIAAGDQDAINRYGIWVNPQVGDELMRRNAAADLTPPVLTTITGSTTTDNAVADGTAHATVKFVVHDQDGQPMKGAALAYTATGTAQLAATTGTTGTDGSASVNLTDATPEAVTVTATSGGRTGTATATFVAGS
jgi:Bacterial Ig-like domain (group 1)